MTDIPADPVPAPPDLDPATLGSANFTRARKGFEPAEVRAMLGRAADALRAWQERDDRIAARLADLERRLDASQELDEQRITTVLGEETARIIAAARDAAADIRSNAEEQANRLISETEAESTAKAEALTGEAEALREEATRVRDEAAAAADAMRADAQEHADQVRADASAEHDRLLAAAGSVLEERTSEAEAVATGIREAAQIELDTARVDGERIRDEAREAAAADVEQARLDGRAMVDEARQLRRQMLQDLAERRRTARRQIEAARAGRDRVVEALGAAGDRVAQVIGELADSDDQAQRAADEAVASIEEDLEASVAELETGLTLGEVSQLDDPPIGPGSTAVVPDLEIVADPVADDAGVGGSDDDGPSPGATVHDLFERIRAERDDSDDDSDLDSDLDGDLDVDGPVVTEATVMDAAVIEATVVKEVVVNDLVAGSVDEVVAGFVGESAQAPTEADETVEADAPGESEWVVESGSATDEDVAVDDVEAATSSLDRRDEMLGATERSTARTLKRLVSDEQNDVLDRLRRIRRGWPALGDLIPEGDERDVFRDGLRSDFTSAAEAGVRFWNAETGDGDSGADPGGADDDRPVVLDEIALDGALEFRVEELLELRRAHVQRALDHAKDEGIELAELVDHVRAAYREWRTRAVPDLAGDLTAAGFALGEQAAAGPGTPWCWEVDNGGLPCSDAEDNALAGPVACGEAFPTGDILPPAHPGCRCILVPPRR